MLHLLFGLSSPTGLAGGFKLIAREPLDALGLLTGQPAKHKAEAGQLGVAAEVPVRTVLAGGLVVVVNYVVFGLLPAPLRGVALEEFSHGGLARFIPVMA